MWLYPTTTPRSAQNIAASYLRETKRERQGLTRAEAKARRLDLYPNSGVSVSPLLNALVRERYLEQDADARYVMSKRGMEWVGGKDFQ